jgi:hypothetical protein
MPDKQAAAALFDLGQALPQPVELGAKLRLHRALQGCRTLAEQFSGGFSVQILSPIPDGLLGLPLSFCCRLGVCLYAGVGHRTDLAILSSGWTCKKQGKYRGEKLHRSSFRSNIRIDGSAVIYLTQRQY